MAGQLCFCCSHRLCFFTYLKKGESEPPLLPPPPHFSLFIITLFSFESLNFLLWDQLGGFGVCSRMGEFLWLNHDPQNWKHILMCSLFSFESWKFYCESVGWFWVCSRIGISLAKMHEPFTVWFLTYPSKKIVLEAFFFFFKLGYYWFLSWVILGYLFSFGLFRVVD